MCPFEVAREARVSKTSVSRYFGGERDDPTSARRTHLQGRLIVLGSTRLPVTTSRQEERA